MEGSFSSMQGYDATTDRFTFRRSSDPLDGKGVECRGFTLLMTPSKVLDSYAVGVVFHGFRDVLRQVMPISDLEPNGSLRLTQVIEWLRDQHVELERELNDEQRFHYQLAHAVVRDDVIDSEALSMIGIPS